LQIKGDFVLLDEGTGKYATAMKEFVGRRFENAQELVNLVSKKPGANECQFILHKDMLQVETLVVSLIGTEFPKGKGIEGRHWMRELSQALIKLVKKIFRLDRSEN
jgi:hypothetical protein